MLVSRPVCSALHTTVYNFNIVNLYFAPQQSLYLGMFPVLYTLVFRKFNCNLVFSTTTKVIYRPVSSALSTSMLQIQL